MILSYFFLSSRNILCCYNLKKIHLDYHMIICFCSRLWLIRSSLYACVHRCIVSFFYNNKLKTIYAICNVQRIWQLMLMLLGPIYHIIILKIMCRFQKNDFGKFFSFFLFLFPYCFPALRLLRLVTNFNYCGDGDTV